MYEGIFMEFCKIMCKKQISELELKTGLKSCASCNLSLPLNHYNKNYAMCKGCKSKYDQERKNKNSEQYSLTCEKCNCEFKWWQKTGRRSCFKCVKTRKKQYNWSKIIQKCDTCNKEFRHRKKRKHCSGCVRKTIKWTHESVIRTAKTCKTRKEFITKYDGGWRYAKKQGILDLCYSHMGNPLEFGFGKDSFFKACERNGTNGIIYLIKCWNDFEDFYKIGITAQGSVENRYQFHGNLNKHMPYNFEVIWVAEGSPELIYDLEKQKHRETKNNRYHPDLWCNHKSAECFKCRKNSKLLKKPDVPWQVCNLLNKNPI